ncbi:TM140 protein, partial [Donacobius atricapilla]|nr:TM140 protein [Donacobius atricapilla]
PAAAFTTVARNHVGIRMGLLQKRCTKKLLHMLTLLETVGTLALMSYALLYEAGNLVNLPEKCIGFYNFCLWNDTAGELQCLDNEHLQAIGIS